MNASLSPLVSEFETHEQEADYLQWLAAKIQESLADTQPNLPHDAVMAQARALVQSPKTSNTPRAAG